MHDLVNTGKLLQWQVVVQSDQPSVKLRSENLGLLKGKQGKGFGVCCTYSFCNTFYTVKVFCIKGTLLVRAKLISLK